LNFNAGKTLGNNKGSIQNFGIVGVTIATEELSKFIFFYCPCDFPRNQVLKVQIDFIIEFSVILLKSSIKLSAYTWAI